jgi:serine/threonine protein kinase/tetratricopeptide (TPR) repeat protein
VELLERLRAALVGRYAVEHELGHGGMAVVFLANDLKQRRPVAVKVLRPELAAALGPERFLREIAIAARLTHPHILPLHDSGEVDGLLFYVTPYIEGASLRDRLLARKQLSIDDAVEITRQVASALSYAHSHDVVHRDIKPENILLQGDEVLVADFGIARAITEAGGERLTDTGIPVGTPAYMSPEQVMGEAALDGRSDVYSLGCVLYELLAGAPPFLGPTAQAILARRLTDPVPPLRTVRDTVPLAVEQAITKALAKTPVDRFATATQFAEALRQSPAPSEPKALGVRQPATRWMVGGIAVLAIVGILTRLLWPSSEQGPLNPNLIAVAPFDVHGASLASWSEGLMEYLSHSLDGAGEMQTVPPSVFLRGWSGPADPAAARALGRRTGAGLVVFGSLVLGGRDSIRLRATLLDVAGKRTLADVEVAGDTLALDRAADSLAVALLQGLGRTRPVGAVRNAPFSGASLPAIKEFLQGEFFYRRSQYDSALAHHARAIALDSSFALAYRRMASEIGWGPPTQGLYESMLVYGLKAGRLNHGLTARDSLLIAVDSSAIATNRASDLEYLVLRDRVFSILDEAARRFPSDPEVWLGLGETRYHLGLDTHPEALQAFDQAIALDSGFAPAYEHVVQLAMEVGGADLARRYTRPYLASNITDANSPSIRLAALLLDPARSGAVDLSRTIDTIGVFPLWRAALEHLGTWVDTAETTIRLFRALPRGRRSLAGAAPWVGDTLMWPQYLASRLLYRGHAHEAYETFRPRIIHPDPYRWANFENPLQDLVLLNAIPRDTARILVARAVESEDPLSPHWLFWWFIQKDSSALLRSSLRAERAERRASNAPVRLQAKYLRLAAAGYLDLLRGDSASALRNLAALPESACSVPGCRFQNLTLARLAAARGDDAHAAEILDRWSLGFGVSPFLVFARLERARSAERLGDRETAIRWYQFVADAWRHADPELQPYVNDAREGLRRLALEPRP